LVWFTRFAETDGFSGGCDFLVEISLLISIQLALLFHEILKEGAASKFGAMFPDLAQGTCWDEICLESVCALPRTMRTGTVATGGRSLAAGSHVIELLAPCALGRDSPLPVWLNTDFNET
jgi:hypothetical protein